MAGKFNDDMATLWVQAYEEIGAVSFACDAVGITSATFYAWMAKGEQGVPGYSEFYYAARRARAKHALQLVQAARKDKGGPAFLLERLFPAEFGAPARAARDAMQVLLDMVLPRVSLQARSEVLDALAAIERERAGTGEPGVAEPEAVGTGALDVVGVVTGHRQLEPGTE